MRIFLETAALSELEQACELGLVDGVIIDQSLVAEAGKPLRELIMEISALIDGPICIECLGASREELLEMGRDLASWHKNIVLKLPLQWDTLQTVKVLTEEEIKTSVTLCLTAPQALLAAKAGATYICPLLEQADAKAVENLALLRDVRLIYDNYGFETQIILPSAGSPRRVLEAARIGTDVVTMRFSLLQQLLQTPAAASGLEAIMKGDSQTSKGQLGPG